jgi:hypothetical protein
MGRITFLYLVKIAEYRSSLLTINHISSQVRGLTNMCSAPLDLFSMLELGGQQPSNAMVAMNQLTAGGQYLAAVNRNRRKKASGMPNPKRMFEEVSCCVCASIAKITCRRQHLFGRQTRL